MGKHINVTINIALGSWIYLAISGNSLVQDTYTYKYLCIHVHVPSLKFTLYENLIVSIWKNDGAAALLLTNGDNSCQVFHTKHAGLYQKIWKDTLCACLPFNIYNNPTRHPTFSTNREKANILKCAHKLLTLDCDFPKLIYNHVHWFIHSVNWYVLVAYFIF